MVTKVYWIIFKMGTSPWTVQRDLVELIYLQS